MVLEDAGEVLARLPIPLKMNRGSMCSRFLDCGWRLLAAYGSFGSPAGVNGLVYVDLLGLCSLEAATEESSLSLLSSLAFDVDGPIENALLRYDGTSLSCASLPDCDAEPWPDDPGREESC